MRFDEYFDAYDDKPALPMLPDSAPGQPHVGMVTTAAEKRVNQPWAKSDKNTDGICLVLMVDVTGYAPVEVTIPAHFTAKVAAVCRSARVEPPVQGQDWDERELVGRTVTFESAVTVSARGTEYVRVNKWLSNGPPLPAPAAKPKPPARTPTKKADAAASAAAPDDIPF